ncbi:paeninodin family lasso peptide [Virgibacillus sp. C22-A2]|uniref:Paeninodin family lasso peptide n=1 Tax=Virgibacillus tibetensis TaxID=3042313 RepID=A0ABU6KFG6_9BACI|nr:paeninodin family lasso peptide [Virgibacillus sp. C22-A2]
MKMEWKKPVLEVLDISMTMNGPGNANADCFDVGEAPGKILDPETSQASCLNGS